jgi:hypothetical protein
VRLYTVSEERDMTPVAMTNGSPVERSSLGEPYVLRHAPEGIRLAFMLTGDRDLSDEDNFQRRSICGAHPGFHKVPRPSSASEERSEEIRDYSTLHRHHVRVFGS